MYIENTRKTTKVVPSITETPDQEEAEEETMNAAVVTPVETSLELESEGGS